MNRLKPALICYLLPAVAVAAVAYGYPKTDGSKNRLCNHQYALCTSAQCVPQPGDPTKAICYCDVEEGKSMSTAACDQLKPSTDENGVRTVYSTFSFKQIQQGKKGMACPSGTPWTNCLNKRCTVDPADPTKAICVCDVMRNTGEWLTLGGDCDTSTCEDGYWSGALPADHERNNMFMAKALGLDKSPAKSCPVKE